MPDEHDRAEALDDDEVGGELLAESEVGETPEAAEEAAMHLRETTPR